MIGQSSFNYFTSANIKSILLTNFNYTTLKRKNVY